MPTGGDTNLSPSVETPKKGNFDAVMTTLKRIEGKLDKALEEKGIDTDSLPF